MIRTTPFHARLSELNTQGLYTHWQGHLSALRYSHAPKHEYFAVRNSVGVFDTSPLFKYRITGPDAERFLAGVLTRDIRTCRPGQAQYTLWCDDRGFVMEDGVVFRHSAHRVPADHRPAEPRLVRRTWRRRGCGSTIEDVSDDYGILAVQGPRSARGAAPSSPPRSTAWPSSTSPRPRSGPTPRHAVAHGLHRRPRLRGHRPGRRRARRARRRPRRRRRPRPAALRRGGADDAAHRGRPAARSTSSGATAGWRSADDERVTPKELGMGWMLRGVRDGRPRLRGPRRDPARARRGHVAMGDASASSSTGQDWDRLHRDAGLLPPRTSSRCPTSRCCTTTTAARQVGYATSFMYSPVLQRHIGLARVRPDLAATARQAGCASSSDAEPPHRHRRRHDRAAAPVQPRRKTARP